MSQVSRTRPEPVAIAVRALIAPVRWLERTRGPLRLALVIVYLMIAAVPMALLLRASTLRGLPDVGDPFDVSAALARWHGDDLDAEDNAATWYRRAGAAFQTESGRSLSIASIEQLKRDPRLLSIPWVQSLRRNNQEALSLWLAGTDQDRIAPIDPGGMTFKGSHWPFDDDLAVLSVLEARDRMDQGDMEGAWRICLALLRYANHCRIWAIRPTIAHDTTLGPRSQTLDSLLLDQAFQLTEQWASHPRTNADLLRQAIDDVKTAAAMTKPSDAYKVRYVTLMRTLDDPPPELIDEARGLFEGSRDVNGNPTRDEPQGGLRTIRAARWFLHHDRARARRVIRLVFANWLTHCDAPMASQPPELQLRPMLWLFQPRPNDPPASGALPPDSIARWYDSSPLARRLLIDFRDLQSRSAEHRLLLGQLIVNLAEEWHLRDHGAYPDAPRRLVGPYLDRLPDGFEDPALIGSDIGRAGR